MELTFSYRDRKSLRLKFSTIEKCTLTYNSTSCISHQKASAEIPCVSASTANAPLDLNDTSPRIISAIRIRDTWRVQARQDRKETKRGCCTDSWQSIYLESMTLKHSGIALTLETSFPSFHAKSLHLLFAKVKHERICPRPRGGYHFVSYPQRKTSHCLA